MAITQELRDRAIAWARQEKLHALGARAHFGQAQKLIDQAEEVADALRDVVHGASPIDELMLEIGRLQAVLTILCDLAQVSQDECLKMALENVKNYKLFLGDYMEQA